MARRGNVMRPPCERRAGHPSWPGLLATILAASISLSACEDGAAVGVWVENASAEQLVVVVTEQMSTADRYMLHPASDLRVVGVLVKSTPGSVRVEILREVDCTSIYQVDLALGVYRVSVDTSLNVSVSDFPRADWPDDAHGLPRSYACTP